MLTSSDFSELLSLFEKHKVLYLVVGGYAVMKYTEPRFTKDLDLLIATDPGNAKAVHDALKEFGAPLKNLSADDFMQEGYYYQMGRAPLRVDIMMSIPGITFEDAWENREVVELDGIEIPFVSRNDLIRSKKACGRDQDVIDIKRLQESQDRGD